MPVDFSDLVEQDLCKGGGGLRAEDNTISNYSHWASSGPDARFQKLGTKIPRGGAQVKQRKDALLAFYYTRRKCLHQALLDEDDTKAASPSTVREPQTLSETKVVPVITPSRLVDNMRISPQSLLSNSSHPLPSQVNTEARQIGVKDSFRTTSSVPSRKSAYGSPDFSRPPRAPSTGRFFSKRNRLREPYLYTRAEESVSDTTNKSTHLERARRHAGCSVLRDRSFSLAVSANPQCHRNFTGSEHLKAIYRVHDTKKSIATVHNTKPPQRPACGAWRRQAAPSSCLSHAISSAYLFETPKSPPLTPLPRASDIRVSACRSVRPCESEEGKLFPEAEKTQPANLSGSPAAVSTLSSTKAGTEGALRGACTALGEKDPHDSGADPAQKDAKDLDALIDRLLGELHKHRELRNRLSERHTHLHSGILLANAQIEAARRRIRSAHRDLRRVEHAWRDSADLVKDYQCEVAWNLSLRQFIHRAEIQQARISSRLQREVEEEVLRCVANGGSVVFAGEDTTMAKVQTLQRQVNRLLKRHCQLVVAVTAQQLLRPEHVALRESANKDIAFEASQHERAAMTAPSSAPMTALKDKGVVRAIKKNELPISLDDPKMTKEGATGSLLQNFRAEGHTITPFQDHARRHFALDLLTSSPQAAALDSAFMTDVCT